MSRITRKTCFIYGLLGLPLAMIGLPIYIHLPPYYTTEFGLSLASIGLWLMLIRISDAFLCPILGFWSDKIAPTSKKRALVIAILAPVASGALWALVYPPTMVDEHLLWFVIGMACCTFAYIAITIQYLAIAAQLTDDYHQQTRLSAWREILALIGVLAAALLPALRPEDGLTWLAALNSLFMLLGVCCLFLLSSPRREPLAHPKGLRHGLQQLWAPLALPLKRWLLGITFINALAAAIPATLIMFYTRDVLQEADMAGSFLAIYFLCGALAIPVWQRLSHHCGKKRAWMGAMVLAVASFFGAAWLGPGDGAWFIVICAFSGASIGADMMFAPSMMADALYEEQGAGTGTSYGIWSMIAPMTTAISAGIVLPLLAWAGYQPNNITNGFSMQTLALCYGGLPCLIKLSALYLLFKSPLDSQWKKLR
jgi:Na+/melibiose symporter-like transporter